MEEDKLIKILKGLKEIHPDQTYTNRSRMYILATPKPKAKLTPVFFSKKLLSAVRYVAVFGIAAILIFSIINTTSYINENYSPVSLDGLNQKSLITEADEMNNSISITLKQIQYLDQSNQKALNTINEISKTKPDLSASNLQISTSTASSTLSINTFLIPNPTSSTSTPSSTNNINNMLNQVSQ